MNIEWQDTERGLAKGTFKDRYGVPCSIQESSLATEAAIWLGCEHETHDNQGTPCGARMHLTRGMAGQLARILAGFSETGDLSR
jgi:hypothetical protein